MRKFGEKEITIGLVLLPVFICILSLIFLVHPKLGELKKIKEDVEFQKNVLKTKEGGQEGIKNLREELERLQKEKQDVIAKQQQDLERQRLRKEIDIISFLTNWTEFARRYNVKILKIMPISESSGSNIEIIVEGSYPNLYNYFNRLKFSGNLPNFERFSLVKSDDGYPKLKLELVLNLKL